MILEIHAHSSKYSSCSKADPVALVMQARRKGMQGIILTEHHYQWTQPELDRLRRQSEIENAFLILAGQEVETDTGHVLVYGADAEIEKGIALKELRKRFPGAALVLAHPFRSGSVPAKGKLLHPVLDAVEIFNCNQTAKENYLGLKLWHEYKFNAVAGSDAHAVADAAVFSTYLIHPITGIKEFVEEVKRRRCFPFLKEIPKSGTHVVLTEITMGTKGADETRSRLITKHFSDEKSWDSGQKSLKIRESIYNSGFDSGKYRVPKTVDIDEKNRLIIEEGQRGDSLFDTLAYVSPRVGAEYFDLAAEWLAKLHGMKIETGNVSDALKREKKRFVSYKKAFFSTDNPYLKDAEKLIDLVENREYSIFSERQELSVLCHGDYHPKNVIIGQDRTHDIGTLFISVIDFDSFIFMPAAFDIGYFLSQFRYQFRDMPHVLKEYSEDRFIDKYVSSAAGLPEDFAQLIRFFRLRAELSIAAFLIKVGKGQSGEMDFIMKGAFSLKEEL